MTNIQLITKCRDALVKQGQKSFASDGLMAIRYIDSRGRRCAIGHLLTRYDPAIEGCTVADLESAVMLPGTVERKLADILQESGIDEDQWPLLERLQEIHDTVSVQLWPDAFASLLEEYEEK